MQALMAAKSIEIKSDNCRLVAIRGHVSTPVGYNVSFSDVVAAELFRHILSYALV